MQMQLFLKIGIKKGIFMQNKLSEVAVLIVGSGPIGMSMAILLKMRGISYRIVEKNSGPSTSTKAIAIHSRSLEIFREMGVADKMVETGFAIKNFSIQAKDKKVLNYDFSLLNTAYPILLSLPQPQSEKILIDKLSELGVNIEWNTEFLQMEQNDDHVVSTIKHLDGTEEKIKSNWLFCCEGARSSIRKSLNIAFDGDSYNKFFMLADADIEWSGKKDEGVFFLGKKNGYVAVAPVDGQGRYRLFVEMSYELPPEDQRPALDIETFERICAERGQPMKLSNIDSTTIATFQHRQVKTVRKNRVFLLGDSAHIGSPIGGQWMNLGISEVYNLVWKITYVEQGLAKESLLDSYQNERYPVTMTVEKTAHTLTRLITITNPVLVKLRNGILPLVSRLKKVQYKLPRLISGHSYNYCKTALVKDDLRCKDRESWKKKGEGVFPPDPIPKAGQLAPDTVLWSLSGSDNKRLLDLMNGDFVLLIFTGEDQFSAKQRYYQTVLNDLESIYTCIKGYRVIDTVDAEELQSNQVIADPDWRLHRKFHAKPGCMVLIRPDGYIAYQTLKAEGIYNYLNKQSCLIGNIV